MARKRTDIDGRGDVLIARFSALGDVAMTIPLIYGACRANPNRRFIMLTRRHPASIFINRPENLVIHPVDTNLYKGVSGMWRLYRELEEAYDIVAFADLHDVLRTKLLRLFYRMSGRGVSHVDKGRSARRRLTRPRNKHMLPLAPMPDRYADVFRKVGVNFNRDFQSIFTSSASELPQVRGIEPKSPSEKWIAIAPFARHEGKIYPADLMGEVIDNLLSASTADSERKIFIFGFGDAESREIENWRRGRKEVVNMAELNIGIPAELALMANCDVMLSMDSANMHLAALVGLRTISIWGATHPYCGFRPSSLRDEDILQLDMTCRPCSVFGNKPCRRGDLHCLRGISPARVAVAVEKALYGKS